MFQAVPLIYRKPQQPVMVHDHDQHYIDPPIEKAKRISEHFRSLLTDDNIPALTSSSSDSPLSKPITRYEVEIAIGKLKNGRAAGIDDCPNELYKYAPSTLASHLAEIYNDMVMDAKPITIGDGVLIPIPKPGKPAGPPSNLRPILLLTTLRKILSLIVLRRIRGAVGSFLSPGQSGFQPGRSTTDIVSTLGIPLARGSLSACLMVCLHPWSGHVKSIRYS